MGGTDSTSDHKMAAVHGQGIFAFCRKLCFQEAVFKTQKHLVLRYSPFTPPPSHPRASIPLGWRTDRSWKWTPRPLKRTEGCLELGSHFASGNSRARLAESSTNGDPLPLWSCLVKHSSPCRSYSLPATWNAQASSPRMAWHQNLRGKHQNRC